MATPLFLILFLFLLFATFTPPISTAAPSQQHTYPHFLKHSKLHENATKTQLYFEVTPPLPTDGLTPACTLPILRQNFSNTYGEPPVTVSYSPPFNCSWTRVVMEFSAACSGEQYDRIAAVWLDGAEILRTSTAEPTEDGIFWNVQKDVTRYSSLLNRENRTLAVMLENIVNDVFTGVYHVNVTFFYYDADDDVPSAELRRQLLHRSFPSLIAMNVENTNRLSTSSSSSLYSNPADLIIPISGSGEEGFWFRIESGSDLHSKQVRVPKNTYKAVLEIYVSFHGNDEFWYKNFPDSYIVENNLDTKRGNGAYREVFATIDGEFVGSVVPFPVIFTGGINPLFWEPVVGIGSFDLPTYDVDLTPMLGLLIDGNSHSFALGVEDGISFWLVDANLHLWLDHSIEEVQATYAETRAPVYKIERETEFDRLDGKFEVEMERKREFTGWVSWSGGNVRYNVKHELEFENKIKVSNNGVEEKIKQRVSDKLVVKVESYAESLRSEYELEKAYPLTLVITTLPPGEDGSYAMTTSLENSYQEKASDGNGSNKLSNTQRASGWLVVNGSEVVEGEARTDQVYVYKDNPACYSRMVSAAKGTLLSDTVSLLC